ncbi:MAG: hypothetical protein WC637_04290, partial [Victivallales bacterium]
NHGIYPTFEESRFMAYDAIVHGATGIIYWGIHRIAKPAFFKDLYRVTSELKIMSQVFVSPTVSPVSTGSSNSNIALLHKNYDGNDYIIAANESKQTQNVTFYSALDKTKLQVAFEDRQINLDNGQFSDTFKPNEVHVYTTSKGGIASIDVKTDISAQPASILESMSKNPLYNGKANWIWCPEEKALAGSRCFLRRSFALHGKVAVAKASMTADDRYTFYVNGKKVGNTSLGWALADTYDIASYLKEGENVFAVEAADAGGIPYGFLLDATIKMSDGTSVSLITDEVWQSSQTENANWYKLDFKSKNWQKSRIVAPYGGGPWSHGVRVASPGTSQL